MKSVDREEFTKKLKDALCEAHFNLREDIRDFFLSFKSSLKGPEEKKIVDIFIENSNISKTEKRALCQDTGYVQFFIEIGRDVHINFSIEKEIETIIAEFYEKNYLRKSLADPITKLNTQNNTPVFINYNLVEGEELKVDILIKGGGSENVTKTKLLLPAFTSDEIEATIVKEIESVGSSACPPYIIGVCIGANLEKALYYSKRLLLYRINDNPMNEREKEMAERLKEKINSLPIGFQGLKFGPTVIDLKVKIIPCHIATLPLAISIGCNAVRQASFKI